jgi:vacuolar protein sorting-associated protein 3
LHRHEEALHLLAHDLKDFQGAETYCYSGGTFETVKSLDDHAALQRDLFTRLLGEYLRLNDVSDRISQTVNLLDRWGRFFDVKMVISLTEGVDGVGTTGRSGRLVCCCLAEVFDFGVEKDVA